jgi:uncharacterized damage-inducible protein DinB
MVEQIEWVERKFNFDDLNVGLFPNIVERLRGTPARLEETLNGLPEESLIFKSGGKWSLKEEAGHLYDLEELWCVRLKGLLSNTPEIVPADMTNKKTHKAGHNDAIINEILYDFRSARMDLVSKLGELDQDQVLTFATHPRLQTKMRIIDLVFFAAEHDDHHLAAITQKKSQL